MRVCYVTGHACPVSFADILSLLIKPLGNNAPDEFRPGGEIFDHAPMVVQGLDHVACHADHDGLGVGDWASHFLFLFGHADSSHKALDYMVT